MTPKKPTIQPLAIALLLFTLALAVPNLLNQKARAQDTHSVTMQDLAFSPQNLAITKGETVEWTNNDVVIYTLWFVYEENQTTYLLSNPIEPEQSWSHTFNNPAKLTYHSFERLRITGRLRIVYILGDINWDNKINIHDLYVLGKHYQTTPTSTNWNEDADINFDNTVNQPDLTTLSENYGKTDP